MLRALSLFLIGRALLRRQKWGGYAGVFVMVAPLVMQSRLGKPIAVVVIEAALSFVSVAVLASAWKELDSNAEVEELNDLDDDEPVLTPRNHGYGEPRSLPLDGLPDLLGTRDPVKLGRIRVNEPSCGGLAP